MCVEWVPTLSLTPHVPPHPSPRGPVLQAQEGSAVVCVSCALATSKAEVVVRNTSATPALAQNAASGDGVVKRTRGRPKGSRDLRPRVKRKSDTWDEVEGESGGRYKGAAHAQMAERHGGQMAGPDAMGVGVDLHGLDSVDLYGVFSKTGAVAVQQRTWRGKQSSSNTSHSQSS